MEELKMNGANYKCPMCHTTHSMNDCKIEEWFVKSTHTGSTVSGRTAVHKFVDSYLYVRLCPSCYKKLHTTRKVIKILFLSVVPILLTILMVARDTEGFSFGAFIVWLAVCYLISYIIGGIIIRILEKSVFDFDYEQADKDNALLTPYEVMNYKNEHNEN